MTSTSKPRIRVQAGTALKVRPETAAHFRGRAEPPPAFDAYTPPPGVAPAGAMLAMDTTIYQWALSGPYGYQGEGLSFLGYAYLAELTQRPEYRRISETIAKDMTRKWIKLTASGDDDKTDVLKAITDALDDFRVQDVFRVLAEQDGFFGRSHLYIDTGKTDEGEALKTPLFIDPRTVGKGSLKAFRVVEPIWVYPNNYNSSDPLAPNYYRPQSWFVMGKEVHASRLMTFVSRAVPDLLKPAYAFGGVSLSQLAKPYVDNWIRTRQSVSDLLHSFSKDVLATNLSSILQGGAADSLVARADAYIAARDNRGLAMIDKDTEEFINVATPLGTLDKLQAQSQEQMSSVSGIPLVVLLGITPSGLNASSDGEIKTYYAWIASQQEALFKAPLRKVIDIVQLHLFGAIDPAVSFDFNTLWEDDDTALAGITKTKADTDIAYIDAGVLHPEEIRTRLAGDDTSPYHGLDLSDPPPEPPEDDTLDEPASETPEQPNAAP